MKFIQGLLLVTLIGTTLALAIGFMIDPVFSTIDSTSDHIIFILIFFGIIMWLNSFDIKDHRNS